jgi:hypothetical protein
MQDARPTRTPTPHQIEAAALAHAVRALAAARNPMSTGTGRIQNQHLENAMLTLTDEMKSFIVMGLARFDSPTTVAKAVRSKFGVEVTRHQVHRYE